MDIRKALSSDTAALIDVIDRAYEIYRIELPDLPDVSAGVAEDMETGNVWEADDDGIKGGVFLTFNPEYAVLTNIAVDPLQAGKGIGKALIMRAEDECRNRSIKELKLATHVNMPENVALYTHLGWVETSREGNKVFMSKQI